MHGGSTQSIFIKKKVFAGHYNHRIVCCQFWQPWNVLLYLESPILRVIEAEHWKYPLAVLFWNHQGDAYLYTVFRSEQAAACIGFLSRFFWFYWNRSRHARCTVGRAWATKNPKSVFAASISNSAYTRQNIWYIDFRRGKKPNQAS